MMRINGRGSVWVLCGLLGLVAVFARQSVRAETGIKSPGTRQHSGATRLAHSHATAEALSADPAYGPDDPESRPLPRYHKPKPVRPVEEDPGSLAMNVTGKLALVIALILGCAAAWKRFQLGTPKAGPLSPQAVTVTSTVSLGPQRLLHLVSVGQNQLLLASSPQGISLIATLDGNSSLAGMDGSANTAPPRGTREGADEPYYDFEDVTDPLTRPADRFEELLSRLRDLESGPDDLHTPLGRQTRSTGSAPGVGRDAERLEYRGIRGGEHRESPVARDGAREDVKGEKRAAAWGKGAGDNEGHPTPSAGLVAQSFSPGTLFRSSGRAPDGGADA